jgi:hypothetical protein
VPIGSRLTTLLVVLALVALPAVALRVFCVGKSCDSGEATASAEVPFCPLPAELRALISAGFRQGRSPDVMAATAATGPGVRVDDGAGIAVPWPSTGPVDTRVPIAFFGSGFTGRDPVDGTGLDQVAPTLAQAMGYDRSHDEVRAGVPAQGVAAPGDEPSLVVQVVWKGVGSADLEAHPHAWPFLRATIDEAGGTLDGTTGSLPLDPTATLTTIGTGGLPSQHGITGTVIRGDDGDVAQAWGPGTSGSVIATLADDLDHDTDQQALVAGVLSSRSDRGIIGDGWYVDRRDRDTVVVTRHPVPAVTDIVDQVGPVGGVIGVVVHGDVDAMDRATRQIVRAVRAQVPSTAFVVTSTGSLRGAGEDAAAVAQRVNISLGSPVIAASAADGLFLDRTVATRASVTAAGVSDAMSAERSSTGDPLFAGTFPSFAVAFARYC